MIGFGGWLVKAALFSLATIVVISIASGGAKADASSDLLREIELRTGLGFHVFEAAIEKNDPASRRKLFEYASTHPLDDLKAAMKSKLASLEKTCPKAELDGRDDCHVELDHIKQELSRLGASRKDSAHKSYLAALAYHNQLKLEVLVPFLNGTKFKRSEIEGILSRSRVLLSRARAKATDRKVAAK